jgi:hypothetical protein
MTSILPFISNQHVALASDRRITWLIGGATQGSEDTENKAIALCGHFLMGYTGFARLGGVKTEQWIVDTLADVTDPSQYFRVLSTQAAGAVRSLGLPQDRSGHAFVAVGYATRRGDPPTQREAVGVTISNATGGGYGVWRPRDAWEITRTSWLKSDDDFRLGAFGIVPDRRAIDQAIDAIRRYRKRDRDRIVGVVRTMIRLIRSIDNDGVSEDVSVSVLPRSAVPASEISIPLTGLRDPVQKLTCVYAPADREAETAIAYPPASVCPGLATHGDEIWSRKPPWWKD